MVFWFFFKLWRLRIEFYIVSIQIDTPRLACHALGLRARDFANTAPMFKPYSKENFETFCSLDFVPMLSELISRSGCNTRMNNLRAKQFFLDPALLLPFLN
jgi:hypothetical protein